MHRLTLQKQLASFKVRALPSYSSSSTSSSSASFFSSSTSSAKFHNPFLRPSSSALSSLSCSLVRSIHSSSVTSLAGRYGAGSSSSSTSPYSSSSNTLNVNSQVAALLTAAGSGDMAQLEQLLKDGANVNDFDYAKRRPLHVAAAENKLDAVRWLVSREADINAVDRFGNTALDEALSNRHDEIIKELRSHGAAIGKIRMQEMGSIVCQAASEGNIAQLSRLAACGVDINKTDYDGRSPLHLAASEGHASTVEFLLKHGAKINCVDRFGRTPLMDATRSRSKNKKQIITILLSKGAQMENADWEVKNDSMVQSSISRSLPFLCYRLNAIHSEAWLPNEDESEFLMFDGSSYTPKEHATRMDPFVRAIPEASYINASSTILGRVWASKKYLVLADITERDLPARYDVAKQAGLTCSLVLPLMFNDKPFGLLRFYLSEHPTVSDAELAYLQSFAAGLVTCAVFSRDKDPMFNEVENLPKGQMAQVYKKIVAEEVFNANLCYHEIDWFYHLGLHYYYFQRFSPSVIADHVHSFIAAKKLAATTGKPDNIMLQIESKAVDGSPSFLAMCPMEHEKIVEVEKKLQQDIYTIPSTRAYTLEFFQSVRPVVPGGNKPMGLYVLESCKWVDPSKIGSHSDNVNEVCSEIFIKTKTKEVRERYQQVMKSAMSTLAPLSEVFPTYRDGTTPIMFAFLQSAGTTTSYMLQLTELLRNNGLTATRKFIETFANGIIVFSLYLQPSTNLQIDSLLQQFSMLHLVPQSTLTARFLSGDYHAEQYTYNSAVSRFIYYFLNKRSEEFDVLAQSLAGDPLNLGRLRLLQTRLKREAVSQERIYQCLLSHPSVANELFKDFHRCSTSLNPTPGGPWPLNTELATKIKNEAHTVLDQQILSAMLQFNRYLFKTNFYTKSKSALSFRLDPSFLADSDWPVVPYGLFFVMGAEFQGFHLRFRDIARGGIRIIRSADRQAYNSNLETLFAENYGLAYTQNKKNKDIPEFGSKGTILLNLGMTNSFLAFQQYVSGLVDLLTPSSEIVDNYGKQEILFLGPDEGTADFMEWAARYAAKRDYPFWRSFTTGKPLSLGGIPHDRFGMTTRGVHRYVVNALAKVGMKEEQVTKFQTGGPDGDLGSNEILLSKDITRGIVDGSGVVFDPAGLNRTELSRVAHKRVMIKEYDAKLLGPGGFKVLVSDANVTLPSGEQVKSGLAFRNEFHLHPLAAADLFVPCGGRPESVNLTNVKRLFNEKTGAPHFKVIIEGANLFFTQDARMVLEKAGVVLYKDASANKGGVTSSSLEVLAALSLSHDQFEQHMTVRDENKIPAFYQQYVKEIQQRIENDADYEFECIWQEHVRSHTPRYLLTDMLSDKINTLNDLIQDSPLWTNGELRTTVLARAVPPVLLNLVGITDLLKRVPENYTKAIFGAYLASRYIYQFGLHANEMQFFTFMSNYLKPSVTDTKPKKA